MTIEIHIRAVDPDPVAAEGAALLAAIGDAAPSRRDVTPPDQPRRDPTMLAIVAIVLAVPGAVNATMSIARRTRLVERAKALLARLRGAGASATLVVDGETPIDLATATPDQVVDAIARQGK